MKPFVSRILLLLIMVPATSHAGRARLRINEVNANIGGQCDLVELRVIACGDMNGIHLWQRQTPVVTFSAFEVQAESFIVVHFNSVSSTCNPSTPPDETTAPDQYPRASYSTNFDAAYDWYPTFGNFVTTSNVLTLYDADGAIMDAVLLSDGNSLPVSATQTQADAVATSGQWTPATVTGPDFITYSTKDLDATGTTVTGNSIQRIDDTDDNDRFDWTSGSGAASTWGAFNAGQSQTFQCVTSVGDAHSILRLRIEARPSLAPGRTRFYASLPASDPARVEIFDASGRTTAVLWLLPGSRSVEWDGRDRFGRRAPMGPYFARLVTPHGFAVTRVNLLH
jgi:hypothetical protein